MTDPFLIQGPALISFSGGRTSAYMLWRILQAHGGVLPPDVHVVFANTGKEREETLRFVHECGVRWGVNIQWVEWTDDEAGYALVGYNSASRSGTPFKALIEKRGYLPNSVSRFCSVTLKTRAIRNFVRGELGWASWVNQIGLRFDEGHRVLKAEIRNKANKDVFTARMPLAEAGVTKDDVLRFWLGPTARFPSESLPQGFDLGLYSFEGNCDNCFLKRREKLLVLSKTRPADARWWIEMEEWARNAGAVSGAVFRAGDSYANILRDALRQGDLFGLPDAYEEEADAECGDVCGGDTPSEIAALQAEFERGAK